MKLVCLVKRRSGLTPEQFREYYEQNHVPLTAALFPFFTDYRRNYVRHDSPAATAHFKDRPGVDIDVITEMYFDTERDYERMLERAADPTVQTQIVQDESQFMDRGSVVIFLVDECRTRLDGIIAKSS